MTWQQFKHTFLIKFWSPVPAVIAAGILSTYYFGITGTFWAVTGEFTRWGGQLLQLAGVHTETWGYYKLIGLDGTPLTRIDGMMIIGMFGGCFAAALWANNVKLRLPKSRIRIAQAIVGGMIAGFGARLAMGCNLAAFFTGIPQFSLHAWFFALATALGSWFGARFTLLPIFRIPVKMVKVSAASPLTQRPEQARRRFRLVMLHHPLLPEPARRLDTMRRLIDAPAVIGTLRAGPATRPHLVVHGHNHEFKQMAVPGTETPIIQVASASRAGNRSRAERLAKREQRRLR